PVSFTHHPTTGISTLSLHDALPICQRRSGDIPEANNGFACHQVIFRRRGIHLGLWIRLRAGSSVRPEGESNASRHGLLRRFLCVDRKSTRLNSSHVKISYAVFCLKK